MGALVVYDITKKHTFENLQKWLSELQQHADPNVCVMIVGNKTDLRPQRTVLHDEGRAYAGKTRKIRFFYFKRSVFWS